MSVFDQAKGKAEQYMGDAKEKLGQNKGDRENQGEQGGGMDQLKDKASDAMDNAKERFGQQ
jgi:uncharacterized protein YjbJ (UPF0337 family)